MEECVNKLEEGAHSAIELMEALSKAFYANIFLPVELKVNRISDGVKSAILRNLELLDELSEELSESVNADAKLVVSHALGGFNKKHQSVIADIKGKDKFPTMLVSVKFLVELAEMNEFLNEKLKQKSKKLGALVDTVVRAERSDPLEIPRIRYERESNVHDVPEDDVFSKFIRDKRIGEIRVMLANIDLEALGDQRNVKYKTMLRALNSVELVKNDALKVPADPAVSLSGRIFDIKRNLEKLNDKSLVKLRDKLKKITATVDPSKNKFGSRMDKALIFTKSVGQAMCKAYDKAVTLLPSRGSRRGPQ